MTPRALLDRLTAWAIRRPPRPGGLRGVGDDWERLAERHLKDAGFRVIERNFRAKPGEVDLVAEENGVICFVEVKGRRGEGFGSPAEAVTAEKQRRIFRAAEAWLARERRGEARCRFDVVSIRETADGPEVEILRDAFRGPPARRRRR
ncbi:MAG: YraN family protein [Acidobacteriota bacterium]|nr:YraN family protein [Acidobacteriota bacterium]